MCRWATSLRVIKKKNLRSDTVGGRLEIVAFGRMFASKEITRPRDLGSVVTTSGRSQPSVSPSVVLLPPVSTAPLSVRRFNLSLSAVRFARASVCRCHRRSRRPVRQPSLRHKRRKWPLHRHSAPLASVDAGLKSICRLVFLGRILLLEPTHRSIVAGLKSNYRSFSVVNNVI